MCSNSCPCDTSSRSAKLFGILCGKAHRNFINLCHEKRLQIAFGPKVRYSSQCVVHPCHIVFHWVTFWQKSGCASKSCLLYDCPPQSRFIKIPMWCSSVYVSSTYVMLYMNRIAHTWNHFFLQQQSNSNICPAHLEHH